MGISRLSIYHIIDNKLMHAINIVLKVYYSNDFNIRNAIYQVKRMNSINM